MENIKKQILVNLNLAEIDCCFFSRHKERDPWLMEVFDTLTIGIKHIQKEIDLGHLSYAVEQLLFLQAELISLMKKNKGGLPVSLFQEEDCNGPSSFVFPYGNTDSLYLKLV